MASAASHFRWQVPTDVGPISGKHQPDLVRPPFIPAPTVRGDVAYRFVRARPRADRLSELRERLESGEIEAMNPFGHAMTSALENARFDPETGEAVWVEEDYCEPPLAMEREAILDDYFTDLTIVHEDIDEDEGWSRIEELPSIWTRL